MALPAHLSKTSAQGVAPGHPVAQFEVGSHRNFTYALLDWDTRDAVLIDPHGGLAEVLAELTRHRFQLRGILITHSHWDHVDGLPELARIPPLPLAVHEGELSRIRPEILGTFSPVIWRGIAPTTCRMGSLGVDVLATPGHSAGECTFRFRTDGGDFLFTGDTLFIRDCGRTDFPGGSTEQMFQSLQMIKGLPPETIILPGHHYAPECASSLATELKTSPPLRCRTALELEQLP